MATQDEISKFCDRLKAVWAGVPDLRLGQLIGIAQSRARKNDRDLFYMSDEEVIKLFENEFQKW